VPYGVAKPRLASRQRQAAKAGESENWRRKMAAIGVISSAKENRIGGIEEKSIGGGMAASRRGDNRHQRGGVISVFKYESNIIISKAGVIEEMKNINGENNGQ
jgi:hypothetical protein